MPNPFGLIFTYIPLIDAVLSFLIGSIIGGILAGIANIIIDEYREGKKKVSAQLWLDIEKAIKEIKPELAGEFQSCRNKESILAFLNKNFVLDPLNLVPGLNWDNQLMTQTPDILRKIFKKND